LAAKMMGKLDAYQEKMDAWLGEMKNDWKETTACQETTEAYLEERKCVVEHQEVPKEEAAVETVGALGPRRQPKKWTQSDGGSWKNSAIARSPLTCCAIPASRKEHSHQGPGRDNVARGTPKWWMFETSHWRDINATVAYRTAGTMS
jgi:hypothetical protein